MLVAFDFVQQEDGPVPSRQISDCAVQRNAVHRSGQTPIAAAAFTADHGRIMARRFVEGNLLQGLLSEMHQHGIHCDAIEPCGQGRVAFKGGEFSEYLQECVLGEVLGFCRVVCHAEAGGIDSGPMSAKQGREGFRVALLGAFHQSQVCPSFVVQIVAHLRLEDIFVGPFQSGSYVSRKKGAVQNCSLLGMI